MPKLQTINTNFSAGEFSPELEGRVDLEKFNNSAKLLRNVVVMKQGGATIRPPLDFLAETHAGAAGTVRPIPFVFSRSTAYMLEFGSLSMRVWKQKVLVESSPGVPYVLATAINVAYLDTIDYASSGDTMILVHDQFAPKRLRRFADATWVIDDVPFAPGAMYERGERPGTTVTISNVAVGAGRTITATAAAFLVSDVGRTVEYATGVALITAFTDTTHVTATVTQAFLTVGAFAGEWTITGTPQTALTPSAAGPVGTTITMTLAANGWRATDFGNHIEVNGGLVEITLYTSALVVSGVIRRELANATAAPADAWVMKAPAWNAIDGYPTTVTFHQQRLWFGATRKFPQTVWGSRSGLSFDFTPGTADDDAVYKTAASDDSSQLLYLISSNKSLLMLGYGSEFDGIGGVEKPITQTNMQINPESDWGSELVRPQKIGKEVLHAERGGTSLRVLFPQQVDGYDSSDLSIYSQHILAPGLKCISYERKPNSVLWAVMQDGTFGAFTYSREQSQAAWCSATTDGEVEWVATIPDGANDVTYATVLRTIDGVEQRNVETLNWSAGNGKFDSGGAQSDSPAKATWDGLDHLEAKTIAVTADGIYMGTFTVAGGEITLPRTALAIRYGIPYEAKIIVRAPEVGTGTGTSQGQAQSTNRIWLRLLNTIGMKCQGKTMEFRRFGASVLDAAVQPYTGLKDVTDYGWENGESDIELVQDQGAPWTVLAVIRSFTTNAG